MDQAIRSKGIGGSEIASVLGLNKWQSPYQLWLVKTGQGGERPMNKWMEAGTILEDAIAKFFQRRTNYTIIDPSDKTNIHPKYPFVIGTPDRYYKPENGAENGVLECKSTQSNVDDVPSSWFCQLQWYLGITGLSHGSLAWLVRGVDFGYKEYDADATFFEYMVERAQKFWFENVLKGIPPDPIVIEDYEQIYSKHVEGKTTNATDELRAAHKRLTEIGEKIKTLGEEFDNHKNKIKIYMEDSEALMDGDKVLVTWKAGKPAEILDAKALKEAHPRIYKRFVKIRNEGRRFLIKPQ